MSGVRVVKIGGRAQGDPRLPAVLASAAKRELLVIVHGGGDEVSTLQRTLGMEPTFIGGRRVTRAEDLAVVRMVLSGTTNKRLVAQLQSGGARAVGVSGEDGGLLSARVTDATFGRVGGMVEADGALVKHLLAGGFLPVISPLARDAESSDGEGLNVNGDDAAAAIAASLGADELVLVADVEGVLEDGVVISALDPEGCADLVRRGIAKGGMQAKLEAALSALHRGVPRVRIASLDGIADPTAGTVLSLSPTATRGAE